MEVRTSPELGMKSVNRGELRQFKPLENPANLPGRDLNNKSFEQTSREMSAVRPSQTQNTFQVRGSQVDMMA